MSELRELLLLRAHQEEGGGMVPIIGPPYKLHEDLE